jgi:hypothetical protein
MSSAASPSVLPQARPSAAARLERLPFSGYHRTIFIIIAAAFFFDSIDLGTMTFVLGSIKTEFKLSSAMAGLVASASCSARLSRGCSLIASDAVLCSSGAWCCGASRRICVRPRIRSTR